MEEKCDLTIAWTSFEIRNLKHIGTNVAQWFEPWQSSGYYGNCFLASYRSCLSPEQLTGECCQWQPYFDDVSREHHARLGTNI